MTSITEEQPDYTFSGKKYNSLGVPNVGSGTSGSLVNANVHPNKQLN